MSQTTENKAGELQAGRILQCGLAFWESKVLQSAVALGVFTLLAKKPLYLKELEERLGLHPRSARDFLDALVALGFLNRAKGEYSNTPETDFFLDKTKPSYMGGIIEMAEHRSYRLWGSLTHALKAGAYSNDEVDDEDVFKKLYATPAKLKEFLSAMTGVSMPANVETGRKFPWKHYKTFVDVGTAQGGFPVQIALQHPHLTGTGFDIPPVKPVFEEYVASFGLQGRLRFQTGDFFKEDLPKADVIVMGHILHDWDLETKRMLTAKAYKALPEGGAFIVLESIIDDDRSGNAFGLLMSLNMLLETPGGFDFTGADCQGWMKEAGFRETRVEHLTGPDSIVIGIK